ncbi:MAG: hypothetical protein ACI4I2_04455 [Oscillospiraceae bacterium]
MEPKKPNMGLDYQLIQRLFMNIPVTEYLEYVYKNIGMEKELKPVLSTIMSFSDCNQNYIVDFDEQHLGSDPNITVGQMLRIAERMFPANAELFYPQKDIDKAKEAALQIVNSLIIIPFSNMFEDEIKMACLDIFDDDDEFWADLDEMFKDFEDNN